MKRKERNLWHALALLAALCAALAACSTSSSSDDGGGTYTVVFNANGGTGAPVSQTFTVGEPQALTQNTFTRSGYSFNNWNTAADGTGTRYYNGSTVTDIAAAGETVTLYAQWYEQHVTYDQGKGSYTVVYYLNNGTDTVFHTGTGYIGAEYRIDYRLGDRDNYRFVNWNTAADGTGTSYESYTYASALTTTPNATVALYAQWAANYTIVYNANDSSEYPERGSQGVSGGEEVTLYDGWSRDGYSFIGWNTAADGSGTAYAAGATVKDLTTEGGAQVVLYAQWLQNYTVVFDRNSDYPFTWSQSIAVGEEKALDEMPTYITRTGYVFTEWNTAADGTGTRYADGATVKDLAASGETITLYAQWRSTGTYSVTYNANFVASGATAPRTQGAYSYTIDEEITLQSIEYFAEYYGFTRAGYTFTGWNTAPDGSGAAYADQAAVTNLAPADGSAVLYAQWQLTDASATDGSVDLAAAGFSATIPAPSDISLTYTQRGARSPQARATKATHGAWTARRRKPPPPPAPWTLPRGRRACTK